MFLATCLAFAETVLGALAGFADANATLVAVFAIVSLGMVLLALVLMYWIEPAFLTFTGQQALDLRMLQEIVGKVPPELVGQFVATLTANILRGQPTRVAGVAETSDQEIESIQRELELLSGGDTEVKEE